jgi:DNA-binding transcriptional ArsR family regulator
MMAKLFPFRGDETEASGEPRLVDIDDDAADEVFAALSSDTARSILTRLYEGPETASGVAESADTSIQNARYHLEKLESAGLIEPVDTWYSSRGAEMTVYAPTNEPLVVAAGNQESKGVLRRALQRVIGSVGVLALAGVAINRLTDRSDVQTGDPGRFEPSDAVGTPAETDAPRGTAGDATGGETDVPEPTGDPQIPSDTGVQAPADVTSPASSPAEGTTTDPLNASPTATPTETPTPTGTPTETAAPTDASTPTDAVTDATRTVADSGIDSLLSAPPGALFFAGGAVVIAAATVWWYWTRYRPMYGA